MAFKNGDLVTYERCFGNAVCTFIGVAEDLEYNNNCVLLYKNKAVPAVLAGVEKFTPSEKEHELYI